MKRFRVTLLAVCLLLLWLGYSNLQVHLRNNAPLTITIQELEKDGPPREWLHVTGGYQNLLEAINMDGTMEFDSLLVPLKSSLDDQVTTVWFETRDPKIVEFWKTYFFKLDTKEQQNRFADENKDFIYAQRDITGMTADTRVASNNQGQLEELLDKLKVPNAENTVFLSEGKEPDIKSGYIFSVLGILGLIKLFLSFRSKPTQPTP